MKTQARILVSISSGLFFLAVSASAADRFACESAETDGSAPISATVQVSNDARIADISLLVHVSPPLTYQYLSAAYDASSSGRDHVAYAKTGIKVVIYPDPSLYSTLIIGDMDQGTQVGVAMHCRRED